MATLIDLTDVNAWLEQVKTQVVEVEDALAGQLADTVIGAVSQRYSVGSWVDPESTPLLIRRIISMFYAGYFYHRTFSNNSEPGVYGDRLLADAQILLDGVANGTISIPADVSIPVFVVDNLPLIADELRYTDPVFTMGQVF
jgi:hypothetical protein